MIYEAPAGLVHHFPWDIKRVGYSGVSRGGPPTLMFRPNWGPKGREKNCLETAPPPPPSLSEGLDPPPGYLNEV